MVIILNKYIDKFAMIWYGMTERKNTKLYRIPAVAFFYLFDDMKKEKKGNCGAFAFFLENG